MAVKKSGQSGFVMIEVLVTVMIVIFFTVFLFSSVTRRHGMAVRAASKTEARLAAEAAVQVLAAKIAEEESSEILEKLTSSGGLPETDAVIWADSDGEEKQIKAVVSSYWKADGSGLVLRAVCSVNGQEESASLLLGKKKFFVSTPSSAERREDGEEV